MLAPTLLSLLVAAGSVAALPQPIADLVEHERAVSVPASWKLVRKATTDDFLRLRIAVKEHRQIDSRQILARSDPSHTLYGQYLNADELAALLAESTSADARAASWDKVERWIAQHDINVLDKSERGFDIKIRATEAERLLNADFSYYTSDGNHRPVARTEAYSLPPGLRNDIGFVYPTVHFFDSSNSRGDHVSGNLDRRQHFPTGPFDCTKYICPANLTETYNIDHLPTTGSTSKLALAGFLEQNAVRSDWDMFISKYGLSNNPQSKQAAYNVVTLNGAVNNSTSGVVPLEAQLDIQFSTAFTGPLNVTYYLTGGRPPALSQPGNVPVPDAENQQEPYLEFLDFLLAQPEEELPQVVSISYTDDEQAVPKAYADQVCDRFSYLALRGVSVLVASGDAGTQGTRFSDCEGPDAEPRFIPTFPASCPWVTTVGATAAWGGAAGFSSAGFSNYYARPVWQDEQVKEYLSGGKNMTGVPDNEEAWFKWNASGRAYPDLTLRGTDFLVISGGNPNPTKGTSASTPVVASMIALLNDLRLKAGKPVLGFLNPLLYKKEFAEAFTDITQGTINGCSISGHSQSGFIAAPGWDAASGLGAPNFAKLRKLLV